MNRLISRLIGNYSPITQIYSVRTVTAQFTAHLHESTSLSLSVDRFLDLCSNQGQRVPFETLLAQAVVVIVGLLLRS